ncbi:hypothetical protein CYK24_01535 [Trueperella bernardiae]|nr:hypothetical protein AKG36_00825 [Trueperella bernardiae]OFS68688.1 hypothetical protein HMPREF3174_01625 [Trueperella sp. HMSC08H06]PKZ90091.1 hypothetical protein CYK24_01535 [Trueperella bernardiae]
MRVFDDLEYLSVPEVGHRLGIRQQDVRTMLNDRRLLAVRRGPNRALMISVDQIATKDGADVALPSLHGTLTMLADRGFDEEEAFAWLHTDESELGVAPIDALRAGHHRAVRRVILGLG